MATRSLASLSIAFGLVSIPVKVHAATDASAALHFKLLGRRGARLKQQFVVDDAEGEASSGVEPNARALLGSEEPERFGGRGARSDEPETPAASSRRSVAADDEVPAAHGVVERSAIVKGYEFEKNRFVVFTPEELEALAERSRPTIDIVSFVPERSVDPIYFDKPYFLAPDTGGARPYTLLLRAMRETGRCAVAKWAWRSREHVVQIRPGDGGLVLQQLRYADEVRSLGDLGIELTEVGAAELDLATRLIEQIAEDAFDPRRFADEEKLRIRAAIERKVAGCDVVMPREREPAGAEIVDLMQALRASLGTSTKARAARIDGAHGAAAQAADVQAMAPRKPAKRASGRSRGSGTARGVRSGR